MACRIIAEVWESLGPSAMLEVYLCRSLPVKRKIDSSSGEPAANDALRISAVQERTEFVDKSRNGTTAPLLPSKNVPSYSPMNVIWPPRRFRVARMGKCFE